MTRNTCIAVTVAATLLSSSAAFAAKRSETVHFAAGTTTATISGSLKGHDFADYRLGASAGRRCPFSSPRQSKLLFQRAASGSNDVAIFVGSTSGNEFAGNLEASGDYVVRVYLMRNAARRDERCGYSFTVEISATAPAGGGSDDALVPGTDFDATSEIPCSRGNGQPTTTCKCGVKRQGEGTAQVTVFWPDGGTRVLSFEKGELVGADLSQADGDARVRSERQNDLIIAYVGDQRFEIPDIVVFGD